MKQSFTKNLVLTAMLFALGMVLPFLTGQIPQFGNMLLPMHIPVLFCGLICGWKYGAVLGAALPLLRFAVFGMPPLFPKGISMSFELCTYGLVVGLVYGLSKWQCIIALYRSLVAAMLAGRLVWGVVQCVLLGFGKNGFTLSLFITEAFVNAIPGIAIQLVLIPAVMLALNRTGLVKFKKPADADKTPA